ncbi:uncharacterized protein LOC106087519 [Stomoxys calcitrans]|uniref:Ionotropic glutamate receptor C-terminal domain-containing protein n=1 Tax=Stomoxys calcitrans TaxID=35570 RepID=A0A1I8PDV6_STOCA|nr:uncharacterized protein LOC106087519 [Stomoxys calcitrans]
MSSLRLYHIALLVCLLSGGSCQLTIGESSLPGNNLAKWLDDIHEERPFDTLLVAHPIAGVDSRLESVLRFPKPKVLLQTSQAFAYKEKFNSDILVIITMNSVLDGDLMEVTARTLHFLRHVRILLWAWEVEDQKDFMNTTLGLLQRYKMTNVLLTFVYELQELPNVYQQLKPYPSYHWLSNTRQPKSQEYFPLHWLNMQNITIRTHSDQAIPKSFLYLDAAGNLKVNGYVARLILLFAQHFNASLQWYKPVKLGEVSHFMAVNYLVDDNLIDIPMTTIMSKTHQEWQHRSYHFQYEYGTLFVPCAQQLTLKEVFSVLLDVRFFGLIIFCTVLFSLLHSLVDYLLEGIMATSDVLLSHRVLPAVLGQSFVARNSPWKVLKLIYIILSFLGINITCQFSATMNSLFTSHPYHRQIETLMDIRNSPLKLNILKSDLDLMGGTLLEIFRSLITTNNATQYDEMRFNFNTSTGYFAFSSFWRLLELKQQNFNQKLFCTYENMTVFLLIPASIHLQPNSQYKEPMDYLVQQVNAMGLVHAWYASTFNDMVKQKKISLFNENAEEKVQAMTASDLYWIWIILIIGLGISVAVFLAEFWHYNATRFLD